MKKYYIKMPLKGLFVVFLSGLLCSCKKFVEVGIPSNALTGSNVYLTDATAAAATNALYIRMMDGLFVQGTYGITMLTGLASDELTLFSNSIAPEQTGYYKNNLSNQNTAYTWTNYYQYLHSVNSILEGLSKSTSLNENVKNQLEGEAKFLRAFFYFYLVNLYGDVPLLLSSDWRKNSTASRAPKSQVWEQIIKDLKEAQGLLSEKYLMGDAKGDYVIGSEERVRPTKWAATALLGRVYLYTGDWVNAEIQSTILLDNSNFNLLSDLNTVFLKNSKEAIWQLMPVNPVQSTKEAPAFIIISSGFSSGRPAHLSSSLLSAFEANDKRRINGTWINSINLSGTTYYFPFKYKVRSLTANSTPTEYFTFFRLGEQFLIRAEARAHLSKLPLALSDLNTIRKRAGLKDTVLNESTELINAILKERQVELFAESGHRWLDLKRTGKVDGVMNIITPLKANGSQWQSYKQYWPIFYQDLQFSSNLTQTPGY